MTNRNYEMPDWNGLAGDAEEPLLGRRGDYPEYSRGPPPQTYQQPPPGQQYRPQHLPHWLGNSVSNSVEQPHTRGQASQGPYPHYERGGVAASFDFDVGGLATQYLASHGLDGTAWAPPRIDDLDAFFCSMYTYYQNRGLPAILLNQLCSTATLGFTIMFSVFLLACVDWHKLRNCHDESSCDDFHSYVKTPFGQASFYNFIIFCYMSLFFVYWLVHVLSAVRTTVEGVRMESFYRRVLGISLSDLQNMQWSDIMRRLITLHDNGVYRVSIQEKLTEYDIVARIMRKENFMVALINKGVLDIRLPRWIVQCSIFMWEDSDKTLFLTKSLEWSINFCVLQFMFNENAVMTEEFLRDAKGLQRRFFRVGMLQLLLMPFMLLFMMIHFFLENAQQFRSSQSYLGPRQWSPLAIWMFREYNELPHIFEARLNRSYEGANKYVGLFTNGYAATLAKFVAYISGSFVAILVLVSVIDEAVLLYVRLSDHNLLWYLGIFSGIFASSASFIPSQTHAQASVGTRGSDYMRNKGIPGHQNQDFGNVSGIETTPAEQTMEIVAAHTHYFPRYWMHQCHTLHVRDEFLELFPYKTKLFAMEVLSVLLTPLVLCFSLPNCVPDMLTFISRHTKYLDGVGDVCDYSTFDFDAYGNSEFMSPVDGDPTRSQQFDPHVDERGGLGSSLGSGAERRMASHVVGRKDLDSDGKLEQSYMSFRLANPEWTGTVGGSVSVVPTQNWGSTRPPVGISPLTAGLSGGAGISISTPLRGHSEDGNMSQQPSSDLEAGLSASIRESVPSAAGDEIMKRIRQYRRHMTGESNNAVANSLTRSILNNSAVPSLFPPVGNDSAPAINRIPPLHPNSNNQKVAHDVSVQKFAYNDALPSQNEVPTLNNMKNQTSRESVVSSVLDHSSGGGSKDGNDEMSDVEDASNEHKDSCSKAVDYSLTPEEREQHHRLFGQHSSNQSITDSEVGFSDVIDRQGFDRFGDDSTSGSRQALSIDDSVHNSIASILRSALKGEGGESYENDFYWLNKYRSDKIRQSVGSGSGMGSFRTAATGSVGGSDAANSQFGSPRGSFAASAHSAYSRQNAMHAPQRAVRGGNTAYSAQPLANAYYSNAFYHEAPVSPFKTNNSISAPVVRPDLRQQQHPHQSSIDQEQRSRNPLNRPTVSRSRGMLPEAHSSGEEPDEMASV